jgi:hypothetical membrane protein
LIAAPIGAAVGLLLALLVARGFGRPTGRPVPARVAAIVPGVVFVCAGYYLTAIVLLHFLEPEYDPRYFPVSHYVWGTYGWIMTTTFFALALALFTLAVGLRNTRPSSRTARIGFGLLVVGALFICLAGVFKGFPLHDVASAVGLPSVALAVLVLSWASRSLAGCVLALAMFAALLSVMLDVGMPGLQQRAFLFLLLVWLSAAALVRSPVGLEHGDAR